MQRTVPCPTRGAIRILASVKVIGLTGGIGSGKSTVARVFAQLGTPVYMADDRAKALYTEDAELKRAVLARFGTSTYAGDVLNRAYLAQQVFGNPAALADLNALVHPRVGADFKRWKAQQDFPYLIREAAILFESGSHKDCDAVILVSAPEQMRIARVMKRDGVDADAVQARMARQWTDAQRLPLSSHQLHNDDRALLVPQIEALHAFFVQD